VWPGNLVTANYQKNVNISWVIDTWVVTRSSAGAAGGEVAYASSVVINQTSHSNLSFYDYAKSQNHKKPFLRTNR
jgi:hypothetical protein